MESSNFSDFFSFINSKGSGGGSNTAAAPIASSTAASQGASLSSFPSPATTSRHQASSSSSSLDLSSTGPSPRTPASDLQAGINGGGGGEGDGVETESCIVDITTSSFTFTTPSNPARLPQVRCTPIAFYNSEPPGPQWQGGRLIAVSDTFICYAIKDGHIRVINRTTVVRTLLKGHKKPILDAAFGLTPNLLASLGGDGTLLMWKIFEGDIVDERGNRNIAHEVVFKIGGGVQLSRVAWHPRRPTVLAVACPGEIALFDYNDALARLGANVEASSLQQLASNEWYINAHQGAVLDLSFSKDGKYLVTAGVDGWARVWEVDGRNAVGRWQPYGGDAVSRALFLHRSSGPSTGETVFVATGRHAETEIKLWRSWTSLAPVQTQSLVLNTEEGSKLDLMIEADAAASSFLFLADSSSAVLYVAHVSLTPSTARIDRLTCFQLKHPVFSYLALSGEATSAHLGTTGPSEGVEMQLYCVQTQAIQIYHVRPADCIGPPSSTTTTTTSASSSTAAASPLLFSTPNAPPPSPAATDMPTPSTATSTTTASTPQASPSPLLPLPPNAAPPAPAEPPQQKPRAAPPAPQRPGILDMLLSGRRSGRAASDSSEKAGGAASVSSSSAASSSAQQGARSAVTATTSTTPLNPQPPSTAALSLSGEATGGGAGGANDEGSSQATGRRASEDNGQSVASSVVEEQQAGGTRTTEQKQQLTTLGTSRPSLPGESSSSGPVLSPPPPPQPLLPRQEPLRAPQPAEAKSALPVTQAAPVRSAAISNTTLSSSTAAYASSSSSSASSLLGGAAGGGGGASPASPQNEETRAMLRKLEEAQREMSQQLDAKMKKSVHEALVKLAPDLQRSLTTAVVPKVEQAVRTALASQVDAIPSQINAGLEGAGAQLSASVKEPVTGAFRQCFQDQLIPAFQTATQKMFQQISEALNKGLASRAAAGGAETKQEVASLRQDLQELMSSVKALTSEVQSLSAKIDSSTAAGGHGGLLLGSALGSLDSSGSALRDSSSSSHGAAASDTKSTLRALVRKSRYDEAMKQALAANSLELVTWLCKELPRDTIFAAEPPLLSQTALLCLLQQLTFNLERDTDLKLQWLHEIMLVLNASDVEIAAFVPDVCRDSQMNLERFANETLVPGKVTDQDTLKEFRFVQRSMKKLVQ